MRISDWSSDVCSSDLIDLPSLGTELEPALHTAESQAPQPHREREEGQKGEPSAATGNDQTEGGDGRCHRRCNRCGLLDQETCFRELLYQILSWRSDARRVGNEGVSTC